MLLVNTASVRTVIGFWWVYCVIIGATYSANLIAFLAVDKYSPPFETIEDIVAQNEYSFGTLGESVWEIIFQVRSYQKQECIPVGCAPPAAVAVTGGLHTTPLL